VVVHDALKTVVRQLEVSTCVLETVSLREPQSTSEHVGAPLGHHHQPFCEQRSSIASPV
jgi:hypothetical protein